MNSTVPDYISNSRRKLENPYAYLDGKGNFSAIQQQHQSSDQARTLQTVLPQMQLMGKRRRKTDNCSKDEIEAIARTLQLEIWRCKGDIWPDVTIHPIDALDPFVALEFIGYSVRMRESLGQYDRGGELIEVAGLIDNENSHVEISRQFTPEVCKFTAAHELGHAILHTASGLHRDRALDGSGGQTRDRIEVEADMFAALFLMPKKQVCIAFEKRFRARKFVLSEATAFALASVSTDELLSRCGTRRGLSKLLASAEQYDGIHFDSIASEFGVSVEAMAIRLEDIGLIDT